MYLYVSQNAFGHNSFDVKLSSGSACDLLLNLRTLELASNDDKNNWNVNMRKNVNKILNIIFVRIVLNVFKTIENHRNSKQYFEMNTTIVVYT